MIDKNKFNHTGVDVISDFLDKRDVLTLKNALLAFSNNTRHINQKVREVDELVKSFPVRHLVQTLLSDKAKLVRAIFFDKNKSNNWLVPWHQDKTIAVRLSDQLNDRERKAYFPNWTGWTVKDNTIHIQPDLDILNNMVTLRLHLDDALENNANLRVIEGSHKLGILSYDKVLATVASNNVRPCPVLSGGMLVMHPLIIHESHKAHPPKHRRVLHLEFSDAVLPSGADWAFAVT